MGQTGTDERLAEENWAEADFMHSFNLAGIEHLHFFEGLKLAVALVSAELKHSRFFLARIRWLLKLGHTGEGEHKPAIDPVETGSILGQAQVLTSDFVMFLIRGQPGGCGGE